MKDVWSKCFYIELNPYYIAYLKFIVEGYDNMAYVSVMDACVAIVKVVFTSEYEKEVRELISNLKEEFNLEWINL